MKKTLLFSEIFFLLGVFTLCAVSVFSDDDMWGKDSVIRSSCGELSQIECKEKSKKKQKEIRKKWKKAWKKLRPGKKNGCPDGYVLKNIQNDSFYDGFNVIHQNCVLIDDSTIIADTFMTPVAGETSPADESIADNSENTESVLPMEGDGEAVPEETVSAAQAR